MSAAIILEESNQNLIFSSIENSGESLCNMPMTSSKHQLKSDSDSLFLYFTLMDIDTSLAFNRRLKVLGFELDVNKNYLKTSSDTIQNPINHYSKAYTLETFYADNAGTYDIPLTARYRGKYRNCKVLFIHKENRADVCLYFFYNPGISQGVLNKHIDKISKQIRFIN